jgi:hypothetical protein
MKEFLESIGVNIGIALAGLFGSLIMLGKNSSVNLKTTLFAIITGVSSANYITPIVSDMIKISNQYQMGVAFILGFLGLKGVEKISEKVLKEEK